MALKKVPLSEAMNLPLGFEVTEEMFEKSWPQLEASLKKHGWKGAVSKSSVSRKSQSRK